MKISISEKDALKRQCGLLGAADPEDIDAPKLSNDSTSYRPCMGSRCMNWRSTSKTAGVCIGMLGSAGVMELFKSEMQSVKQA